MTRLLPFAIVAVTVVASAGCANRKNAVEPAPWQTEAGKQETRMGIAARMLDLGYAEDAMTLLALAREDGESGAEIDYLTGYALHLLGLHSEAEAPLRRAADTDKRDPRPHRVLGLSYAESDRPDEAIEAFRHAIDRDDTDAATWNNLGFLLYSVKRSPDAVPALREAITLDGGVARYRRNLGFALFNQGDVTGAMEAFRAAGPLDDAMYNLGVAHELAGDLETAQSRYQRALQQNPDHDKAKKALARLDASPKLEMNP